MKNYKPNEVPPLGVLTETVERKSYFAKGADCVLQAVLNGFGGIKIIDSGSTNLKKKLLKMEKSFRSKGVGLQRKTFHSGIIKKQFTVSCCKPVC